MKKHVKSMTYAPKIDAVRSGVCRQTIRKGDKVSVGDEILWHGWSGVAYYSKWNWRLRTTVTEAIPILVDYNDGIGVFDSTYNLHNWYAWDCAQINELAKRDFIDPPIGLALRDVLAGLNGEMVGAVYQIIRWGRRMTTPNNLKFAGWYHDDIAYNPETDCMDLRKVKIQCPECGREFAALLSKHTTPIRHFTIDFDGELPAVEMKTYCIKCKTDFTFKWLSGISS